jgi:GTP-binding protein EngB required for normal cell division
MTTTTVAAGMPGATLPARLSALARLIQIGSARGGPDGFSQELLTQAEELLARAGERLRMSAAHTVVTLAGGTGSGKSSLFNALAGANFSPIGVTRPVTRHPHACVWGMAGAAPLLDWLGVERRYRYARASALDSGETSMTGLLLIDLPDHDTVVAGSSDAVDRLIGLADLMIWVLDPQKYADDAVHSRYLMPLAGHSSVTAVVLNQADLLSPEQADDCESDLRRLLDSEGLHNARLLVTSATTGTGMDELRKVLIETVSARRASSERITADVDGLVARFSAYAGESAILADPSSPGTDPAHENGSSAGMSADDAALDDLSGAKPPWQDAVSADAPAPGERSAAQQRSPGKPPWEDAVSEAAAARSEGPAGVPPGNGKPAAVTLASAAGGRVPARRAASLADAFARAVGVSAVADVLQSARGLQAVDYVGWPADRLAERLPGRDPVRKLRLGGLREELRGMAAGPAGAQQAGIDNALTVLADEIGSPMPEPWPNTVRRAARSKGGEIPAALGAAIKAALPAESAAPAWWRVILAWQWLLMAAAAAGVVWMGLIVAYGVFHVVRQSPSPLLDDVTLLPWVAVMIVAILLLGWLTAAGCQNMVMLTADRERERAEFAMRSGVEAVAREMVLIPVEQEISEYARFCTELAAARGDH